jgi:glucosylceramidase
MQLFKRVSRSVGVALCVVVSAGIAAEVTIDRATTYQTMEGIGASDRISPWQKCNPFCADVPLDNFYDSLINVAGFTLIRKMANVSCGFTTSPGSYSMEYLREEFDRILPFKSVAEDADEPFYVIVSVYGAPGYMKYNNACVSANGFGTWSKDTTNCLDPEWFDEFGDFCATYASWVRDSIGLRVYGFSPANEPVFNCPYGSHTFRDGRSYGRMLTVAGPKIAAALPNTYIYGCEVLTRDFPAWEMSIINHVPAAAPYLHRFAFHAYGSDGQTIDTNRIGGLPGALNGRVWMSEAGYDCLDQDKALILARTIMGFFNNGVSLWNHNGLIGSGHALITKNVDGVSDGTPTKGYWTHAHFARFIRPGWKRVSAASGTNDVTVSAYAYAPTGGMSLVAINSSSSAQDITLSISGGEIPDTFEGKLTSADGNFVDMGAVFASGAITMPANSIMSLGYNHRGTVADTAGQASTVRPVARSRTVTRSASDRVWYYDISGRRVPRGRMPGVAAGASRCLIAVEKGRVVRSIVR